MKKPEIENESFWNIRSIKTAFIVHGFKLILLSTIVSVVYAYNPTFNVVYTFLLAVPIVIFLSFLLHKEILRMKSKKVPEIETARENNEKESSPHLIAVTAFATVVSLFVVIFFNILSSAQTADTLYERFAPYFKPKNFQIVVNVMNVVISFFAIMIFLRLYRRISNSSVVIADKSRYQTITDIPTNQLRQKMIDNPKRVKNLEKQYILFIIIFAISLVATYLTIIVHSIISTQPLDPSFRSINAFDFLTNILNFSGAVFIFLAFKVLHDDTLHSDNTSWTGFWVLPIFLTFMYLLGVGLTYLVCSGVNVKTYKNEITIALNITDLAAGLANGLAMTLLFGRYVAIEFFSRSTQTFQIYRENFKKTFSYTNFISITIIWFLPFYALAQPLFGSLTIEAFGKAEVFQTIVFLVCLIGKIFFFIITYLIIKENVMNLYMHGVVAKVGNPKELEKCLAFDEIRRDPAIDQNTTDLDSIK